MMSLNTFNKFSSFLHSEMKIDANYKILLTDRLGEELEFDSLDIMGIIFFIEDEIDNKITEDEIKNLKTVKDVVDFIDKY